MCHKCVMKDMLRAQLMELMADRPKVNEYIGQMFATMESAYLAVDAAIENGSFEAHDVDGSQLELTSNDLEGIIVSETVMTTMYGLLIPDEVMQGRTKTIMGNLIMAFAIALAWSEDETTTPREALEAFLGGKLDNAAIDDALAREATQQVVRERIAKAVPKLQAQGFDVGENPTDEDISNAVEKFLQGID